MRVKFLAAILGAAAISVPAAAMAGTVIESANIPTMSVPFNYAFTLPSFNTALGALQSVTFKLTDSSTASVDVYNNTNASLAFSDATAQIPLTVNGPGGLSVSDNITAGPVSGIAPAGATTSFTGLTGTHSASSVFTSGLSAFELGSPVQLSYTAIADKGVYQGTGPSGLFFGGSATAGGTFEIIYNYAGVPEPATWAFLLLGVAGIGSAMRRRKDGLSLAAA